MKCIEMTYDEAMKFVDDGHAVNRASCNPNVVIVMIEGQDIVEGTDGKVIGTMEEFPAVRLADGSMYPFFPTEQDVKANDWQYVDLKAV